MSLAAAGLFALLALTYTASIGLRATNGSAITADEPFYLLTTQSLIEDGDLDLGQQYERRSYVSWFDHPAGLWRQSVPREDGTLLSPHDPGLALLLVPGFALGGLPGAQLELLLIAALTFALTFVLVSAETRAPRPAWLVTAAVGLSATAFVYSTEIYPEIPAAALLVGSLLVLRSARGPAGAVVLAVMCTALAWLGIKYAPLAAIVAVAFLIRAAPAGRAWLLGLGGASAVAYVAAHLAIFGALTPYSVSTVYEGAGTVEVLRSHVGFIERAYRLYGLFLDRDFGLGRWAPLLLLVPVALPLLLRAGFVARAVLALIAAQLLVATFVAITMMGWWFPGRTVATVLPLLALPLVLLLRRVPALRAPALLLGAWSVVITAAVAQAATRGEVRIAVDPFELRSPPFEGLEPLFPSYTAWGPDTILLTLGWLALWIAGALAVLGWRPASIRARPP